MSTQSITIPSSLINEDEVFQDELKDWMNDNIDLLKPAMDLDASTYDERAILYDGPKILNVEVTDNNVLIYYIFYWDAYYGCKDQNRSGISEETCIEAELEGNVLFFEEFIPLDMRSTYEEF